MPGVKSWLPLQSVLTLFFITTLLALLWSLDGEGLVYRYVNDGTALAAMLTCTFVYILLMAIPFVPGMELGWLLMGAFGIPGILAAWLGTVAGLTLGFTLARHAGKLQISRTLVARRTAFEAADPATLKPATRVLQHCLKWQQRHPYLFLLAALNLPGNLAIGGGGGIAWISGLTSRVRYRCFIPLTVLATAVIPLLLITGLLSRG